jgi:hypothetical protein
MKRSQAPRSFAYPTEKKLPLNSCTNHPRDFLNYLRAIWTDENAKSIALSYSGCKLERVMTGRKGK